jgi:hypothetical protein
MLKMEDESAEINRQEVEDENSSWYPYRDSRDMYENKGRVTK